MLEMIEKELSIRQKILSEIYDTLQSYIYTVSIMISESLKEGGKVILFGDGRDMEIARYFSSELNEKLANSNIMLPAIVLSSDVIEMDIFETDKIFEKKVGAIAISKDILIGISSSAQSKSSLRALSLGKNLGCRVVGFSAAEGDIMSEFCDINIEIPSESLALSREMMFLLAGVIADMVTTQIED